MADNKPIRAVRSPGQEEAAQVVVEPVRTWPAFLIGSFAALVAVMFVVAFVVLGTMVQSRLDGLGASAKASSTALGDMSTEIVALRNQLKDTTDAEIIFLKVLVLNTQLNHSVAREIAASVHKHAKIFKRDPDFVLAIMEIESNFNPRAESVVGAEGLMQVMPHWKDIMGITGDLKDINTNVRAGLQVYGFYEEMYRDMGRALAAYNRGPSRVDRDLTRGRNPERNGYSDKVEAAYKRLKAMKMNAGL